MKKAKGSTAFTGVKFLCNDAYKDILIAELDSLGYDSMMETDTGLEGYIDSNKFSIQDIEDLVVRYASMIDPLSYEVEELESKNWNEEWEKNYEPIIVDEKCLVRATFHAVKETYPYEIVITPKMSFGTGHHATTYLMLKNQMKYDHQNKRVMDAGCGTAILAIMASKLGAKEVIAFDIDSWSIENAPENIALNQCENVAVLEGTIRSIAVNGPFDIILANINKNVLLDELSVYSTYLPAQGILIISGFYEADEADLIKEAKSLQLQLIEKQSRRDWSSLVFRKDK